MKKVLLVVAMLLLASQVMAGVTVTATQEGTYSTPDGNVAAIIRISYSGNINVRAFALDINVDSGCNFWQIRDYNVGENNYPNKPVGYGIFPSRFRDFVYAATPDACYVAGYPNGNYNPLAAWNEPGAVNTGIGFPEVVAEMGYLGAGDVNMPAQSGTLFRIDVNGYSANDANLTIAADTMRGGIVNKDTNATTTATTLLGTKIIFRTPCINIPTILNDTMTDANAALAAAGLTGPIVITYSCDPTYAAGRVKSQDTGCVAANATINYVVSTGPCCVTPTPEVGSPRATAEAAWTAQGFTLCGSGVVNCAQLGNIVSQESTCLTLPHCIVYTYGIAPAEPNVRGMTRANAVNALTAAGFTIASPDVNSWGGAGVTTVGYVYTQNPVAGTTGCGTPVTLSVVSYPIKYMTVANSLYVNWVTVGKPQCWAYPRQCHGDADGKKQLSYWVGSNDLAIYKIASNKAQTLIPTNGFCADFDHKKQLSYWVGSNDLAIYKAYSNKAESLVPLCGNTSTTGDPNFWYWCLPTGGTCPTSPAGQVCAPAGTCPNTP